MKIEKSPLPENSAAAHYPNVDYSDSFRCRLPKAAAIRPDDLMLAFWTTMPGWLRLLFRVRNLLVKPFGLKTGEGVDTEALREALETSGSCHIMSVAEKTPRETVISLDDKHLRAWLSVYAEERTVYLITLVRYHNKLGVAYFTLIRPFHKFVVKSLFRSVMRKQGF